MLEIYREIVEFASKRHITIEQAIAVFQIEGQNKIVAAIDRLTDTIAMEKIDGNG